jgi:hypothetical protein
VQPWLAPDPVIPGAIAIIAVDDPDDVHGAGDAADVYIVRSTDHGQTWTSPLLVSDGPAGTLQLFPTAATDPVTGLLAVAWYDNRKGQTNAGGNYLFDVRYAISEDGGQTFAPSLELNDIPFDPDLGAFVKDPGPPATLWIGEYFGISVNDGMLSAVWTGNVGAELGTLFDRVTISDAAGGSLWP